LYVFAWVLGFSKVEIPHAPLDHKILLARASCFCIVALSLLKPNMEPKADIALIGLAVMGQNLILNMNDHGYTVVAFNRTVAKVD